MGTPAALRTVSLKGYIPFTQRIELRAGAKGAGRVLWQARFWPDSDKSVEEMERMLNWYIASHDIDLADDPWRED